MIPWGVMIPELLQEVPEVKCGEKKKGGGCLQMKKHHGIAHLSQLLLFSADVTPYACVCELVKKESVLVTEQEYSN